MSAPQWDQGQESASQWLYDSKKDLYYWLKAGKDGNPRKIYEDSREQGAHSGGSSRQNPRSVPSQSSKDSDRKQKSTPSSGKRLDVDIQTTSQGKRPQRREKEYHKEAGYNKSRDTEPVNHPDNNPSQLVNCIDKLEEYGEVSVTSIRPEESTFPGYTEETQYSDQRDHEDEALDSGVGSLTMREVMGDANYLPSTGHSSISTGRPTQNRRETEPPSSQRTGRNTQNKKNTNRGKVQAVEGARHSANTHNPQRFIGSTPGDVEPLDAAYKQRKSDWKKFFAAGRVFSTLWTDPAGDVKASEASQFISVVAYGEMVHTKIRRFVVVRQDDRCCTCLPITTYGNRGFLKPKIDLSHHGLIYGSDTSPPAVQGIMKYPLKVKLAPIGELGDSSYINYGRPYTIDCNVKVKNVGDLDSDSRKLLRRYYNEVNIIWEDDGSEQMVHRPQDNLEDLTGVGGGMMITTMHAPSFYYQDPNPQYRGGSSYASDYSQQQVYHQPASGWSSSASMGPTGYATYATPNIHNNQSYQGQGGMQDYMQSNVGRRSVTPTPLGRSQSYAGHQPHQDKSFAQEHSSDNSNFTESSPIRDQSLHMHHNSVSSPQTSSPTTQFSSPPVVSSHNYSQKYVIDASQGSTTSEHTDPYAGQEQSAPYESENPEAAHWTPQLSALQLPVSHEEAVAEEEEGHEDIRLATLEEAQEQKRQRHNSASGKSSKSSGDKKKQSGRSRR